MGIMKSISFKEAPSLFKLGASFVYECLVVIALSLAATAVFILVVGDSTQGYKRFALLTYLWVVLGVYFVWCWAAGGQTLAMQSWQLKLKAQKRDYSIFVARYMIATLSLIMCGVGFLWALTNQKHQYLHDRLLNITIVDLKNDS